MAMTLIRERGMQGGRMLRAAAGASPARYSCSEGLAHRRRERSGTWQTGPWGAPQARGVSLQRCEHVGWRVQRGSVLITPGPLLCGERAGSKLLISTISPRFRQGGKRELLRRAMALPSVWSVLRVAIPFIWVVGLLSVRLAGASQDSGTVIPAESRPCVDCHAFEFMQRALQDLKKTAYNLDTRTETLLLRAEKRGLCDCFRAIH
uniref:NELL2-interacting cell ontogeny regulator 1 n=1 Tax=Calidris pygmaea TaxID=425635 RepID=A0A8C3JTR6_9CHAR